MGKYSEERAKHLTTRRVLVAAQNSLFEAQQEIAVLRKELHRSTDGFATGFTLVVGGGGTNSERRGWGSTDAEYDYFVVE